MTCWHYRYAGLRVRAELHIPEWAVFEERFAFDDPDVVIRVRPAEPSSAAHLSAEARPDEYRFFVRDAGEYRVRAGREIVVTPVPDAGGREIRLFLLGSAFGALACQRGLLCLHASVVRTALGAVAFCGRAGAGKSTLAAWLCRRGYGFVSDDLCRFECGEGAVAHPSTPRLKLWRDAVAMLGLDAASLDRDHYRAEKLQAPVSHEDPWDVAPLKAVYLLEWGALDVVRLHGLRALRDLVVAATYRIDLLEPLNRTAAHWQRCMELVSRTPVFRFTRPKEAAGFMPALNLLQAHVEHTLGIVAGARPVTSP